MEYSKEFLLKLYKDLVIARTMEQYHIDQYKLGKISAHIHSGIGEEAVTVASNAVMRENDYCKVSHRCYAASYLRGGISLRNIFCKSLGRVLEDGSSLIGHYGHVETGLIGLSPALGIDFCVDTGVALAIRLQKQDAMVFCHIGDGTCNRGQFHEALNFAAIRKLPILFIVDNNQYAISMPIEKAMPVANVADRAAGYNMPSIVCDGTDILAVYESVDKMAEFVRAGNGPALVEAKTYRMRGHFEGDQTHYRSPEEAKEWAEKDCLKSFESKLIAQNLITKEESEKIANEFYAEMEAAFAFAEQQPYPEATDEVLYFGIR